MRAEWGLPFAQLTYRANNSSSVADSRVQQVTQQMVEATAYVQQKSNLYMEDRVAAQDGTSLFVRHWAPDQGPAKAHVLILHGYMDHSGRYAEVAQHLAHRGIASTGLDLRGHGKSPGQRGYIARFEEYLDDVQAALTQVSQPCFILGHSNGALVALDYVIQRHPQISGLIVTNPFLAQTHPAQGLKLAVGKFAGKYLPRFALPAGITAQQLSHDEKIIRDYKRDALVFSAATGGWFREATAAQKRVLNYRKIPTPVFYVYSDADPIASPAANRQLSGQLQAGSTDVTVSMRPGELHEVLNETNRTLLHEQIATWVVAHAPTTASAPS